MRNIGTNGNGTDISIIISIRTDHRLGCAGAPVRTYVRMSVRPFALAWLEPCAPQALLSSLEFG